MVFLKIDKVVINTEYILAVKLQDDTDSREKVVSILMAAPNTHLSQIETVAPNPYHYEWIDFVGQAADALQDYFSSFNNVIDLLPSYQEPLNTQSILELENCRARAKK